MRRIVTLAAATAITGLAMSAGIPSTAAAGGPPQRIVEQQRAMQTPASKVVKQGAGPCGLAR